MSDVIYFLCFCLLPVLGFLFLVFFAISKLAKAGDNRSVNIEQPSATAVPVSEDRFASIDIDQLSPTVAPTAPSSPVIVPRSKVRLTKDMRRQAQADYDTARGTAHLRLLQTAQKTLQTQVYQNERHINEHNTTLKDALARRDTELRRALVHHLVEDEFHTIPGIGPRLASAVKSQVFRGELSDLRNASLVDGIGPQKQAAINDWLMKAERRLPGLLAADSPAKQEITRRYQAQKERLTSEIAAAEARNRQLADILKPVDKEIGRLSAVSVRDFESMLADPTTGADKVNRYLLGSFAPWEPMPDWFARALEEAPPP